MFSSSSFNRNNILATRYYCFFVIHNNINLYSHKRKLFPLHKENLDVKSSSQVSKHFCIMSRINKQYIQIFLCAYNVTRYKCYWLDTQINQLSVKKKIYFNRNVRNRSIRDWIIFPLRIRGYYIGGIRYQDLKALKSSYYIFRAADRIAWRAEWSRVKFRS